VIERWRRQTPPADRRLRSHRLEVRPARLGRDPKDVDGTVFVRVFRVGALLALRVQLCVLRLEGVRDVFEEDQPKDDVLIFRRVHIVAQRVGRSPKLGFEAQIRSITNLGAVFGGGRLSRSCCHCSILPIILVQSIQIRQ
jgi:hypothetical protein